MGACTDGCREVLYTPTGVQRTIAVRAGPLLASHHAWNYCHVHEGDKKGMVEAQTMVEKDVVTKRIRMMPQTRKVKRTIMTPSKTTEYDTKMVKKNINEKKWQYVPRTEIRKRTVMRTVMKTKPETSW
jgi:hypothetical protein